MSVSIIKLISYVSVTQSFSWDSWSFCNRWYSVLCFIQFIVLVAVSRYQEKSYFDWNEICSRCRCSQTTLVLVGYVPCQLADIRASEYSPSFSIFVLFFFPFSVVKQYITSLFTKKETSCHSLQQVDHQALHNFPFIKNCS